MTHWNISAEAFPSPRDGVLLGDEVLGLGVSGRPPLARSVVCGRFKGHGVRRR